MDPGRDVLRFQRWIYGIFGATGTGWAIVMAFIASVPFRRRQSWAWNSLAVAPIIWLIADTCR